MTPRAAEGYGARRVLRRNFGIALTFAVLMALAVPAGAAATANWYAAPSPQGADDCSSPANACSISGAVTAAASGDTIFILGNRGAYDLGATGVSTGAKVLHFIGIKGVPRLIADGDPTVLELDTAPSSATNLYLENDGSGDGLLVSTASPGVRYAISRLFVKTTATMTEHTCLLEGNVTMTDSVCWQADPSAGAPAVEAEFTGNTIRNVVAWASGTGTAVQCSGPYGDGELSVINTIARATGTGGTDLGAFGEGTMFTATLNVRHSNFGTTALQGPNPSQDHINVDATDQHTAPVLVNPAAGNFRERATSSTINAGVTSPANGKFDLAGDPRTVGGKTDIGAYERGTPPRPPHNTRITHEHVSKHRHSAAFGFTADGTVRGFQCALTKQQVGPQPGPHFVSCTSPTRYMHLTNGRYTFEVRAVNSAGPDRSPASRSFTL